MLKIVEIFQQKGIDHKTLLIVSCAIYSFLIWVSETIQIFFFKIRLDMLMFKVDESFQEKDTDHKIILIVSCSICLFLIWVSETNHTVSSKIRPDSWMLRIVEIFQHFSNLFHVNVSYFFYLAPKEFFFLEQNQFLQLLELLKILHQTLILILSAALLYRCGGVRNYFSYKVPVYLPTENIKPFVANGWTIRSMLTDYHEARCYL